MDPFVAAESIHTGLELNFTLSPYTEFDYASVTGTVSFDTDRGTLYNLTEKVNTSGIVVPAIVTASTESVFESKLIIPLYVIIFLLSVVGNSLVLVTLVQNKRMRTVTNVYLLNLAVSDLLLGVFCMPFTLVGQVLRNFIFGAVLCKLIPYLQAVSVSVAVWTLVAISLERYFAICRPLKSRRWQTQFHAYKMIVMVWLGSLSWSAPVLIVSSLKAMKGRGYKCREEWPSQSSERAYNLFLDGMLLFVPLIFMSLAYSLIMSKLWKGLRREIQQNTSCQQQMLDRSGSSLNVNGLLVRNDNSSTITVNCLSSARQPRVTTQTTRLQEDKRKKGSQKSKTKKETVKMWLMKGIVQVRLPTTSNRGYSNYSKAKSTLVPRCEVPTTTDRSPISTTCNEDCAVDETTYTFHRHAIRSNYMGKSIEAKRKVIRMLFVIVAEFFICWAPIHILNTWYLFYPEAVYKYVGSTGISLVQLLAYISSCCNPITYCFMNRKFRQAFLGVFHCCRFCCCWLDNEISTPGSRTQRSGTNKILQNNSDVSGNDSTICVGRASTLGRSEVVVLEAEDRV